MLDVNLSLFENVKFTNFFKLFKHQPTKKDNVKEIIKDINSLLENPEFNREFLCNHLLNKTSQLIGTEYGFIGIVRESKTFNKETKKIECEKILKTLAISNISWNAASLKFYKQFVDDKFEFANLSKTIFGASILNKKPITINKYDNSRKVLPMGHPPIKRFLGVPIVINNEVMMYAGYCNKFGDFTKKDSRMIEKVLNIVGVTFYIMAKFSAEKSQSDLSIFYPPPTTETSTCPLGRSVSDIKFCTMKV